MRLWIPGVVSGLNVVCHYCDHRPHLSTVSVSDHGGKPLPTLPMIRESGN
ncbi:MAG: hypothetical protein AB1Z38_01245 [Desulfotignum sp.]